MKMIDRSMSCMETFLTSSVDEEWIGTQTNNCRVLAQGISACIELKRGAVQLCRRWWSTQAQCLEGGAKPEKVIRLRCCGACKNTWAPLARSLYKYLGLSKSNWEMFTCMQDQTNTVNQKIYDTTRRLWNRGSCRHFKCNIVQLQCSNNGFVTKTKARQLCRGWLSSGNKSALKRAIIDENSSCCLP
eukprot:3479812-Karenia_brevis.AAC.1